jgi:DNA-directed RNA polymerase subunit RPC12/RpoP
MARVDADRHGNLTAREGCSRCLCGCKYWENDRCIDCGAEHEPTNDARCWNCNSRWLDIHPDTGMDGATDECECRQCGSIQDEHTTAAWMNANTVRD